jgi:hypothetical protein
MSYDVKTLLGMSQAQLDDLFRASPPGDIPQGEADGTAIIAPGTEVSDLIAKFVHIFAWKGKVFDPATGTLRNIILPDSEKAIIAQVYKQASWLDGGECIVLDYSKTSLVAHWVRDEIRLVAPGTYLGLVFWERDRLINFALQFQVGDKP